MKENRISKEINNFDYKHVIEYKEDNKVK